MYITPPWSPTFVTCVTFKYIFYYRKCYAKQIVAGHFRVDRRLRWDVEISFIIADNKWKLRQKIAKELVPGFLNMMIRCKWASTPHTLISLFFTIIIDKGIIRFGVSQKPFRITFLVILANGFFASSVLTYFIYYLLNKEPDCARPYQYQCLCIWSLGVGWTGP